MLNKAKIPIKLKASMVKKKKKKKERRYKYKKKTEKRNGKQLKILRRLKKIESYIKIRT